MVRFNASLVLCTIISVPSFAQAQEPPPRTEPSEPAAAPAPSSVPNAAAVELRLRRLEQDNQRLRDDVESLRDEQESLGQTSKQLLPLASRLTGYVDFGFFFVGGDGSGIRSDIGNQYFPEYAGVVPGSWVFMGDPLSTAINSHGDPADTSGSRAVTFDPIHSRGKSSFLLNTVNLAFFSGIADNVTLNSSVDLLPRGRNISDPSGIFLGDYLDVKLGYLEYCPVFDSFALSLFVGKFDSVLGIEYRTQEATDRLAVTPSLICRYTCGRPLGLKVRGQFFDKALALVLAVTNGSNVTEGFAFSNEVDTNQFKTLSTRISYRFPIGSGLEFGTSGAFGAQDYQPDDNIYQWHYGFDLHLDWKNIDMSGEFVNGRAQGKTELGGVRCGVAPCLRYKGAYGQIGYRLSNWLTPYVRSDWRDALHQNGASFVYISTLMRVTAGLRFDLGPSVAVKAEYTVNRELGRLPSFPDDIFTTSMVAKF